MWQYQKTDNLYPRERLKNELQHSDIYLGTDYDDGIRHWKYIKKEKGKNGKWIYYYKLKNPHTKEVSTKEFTKTKDSSDGDEYGTFESTDKKGKMTVTVNKTNKLFNQKYSVQVGSKNGPIDMVVSKGRLEREIIPAVKSAISNVKNKVSQSVQKGKDFITNLFKKKK